MRIDPSNTAPSIESTKQPGQEPGREYQVPKASGYENSENSGQLIQGIEIVFASRRSIDG
jgi:hypothetical protein